MYMTATADQLQQYVEKLALQLIKLLAASHLCNMGFYNIC